jgi:hypothetical protein
MRSIAVAALLAAVAGGCSSSKDPGVVLGGDRATEPPIVEPAARPRPAELGHLTLKVVGMT